MGFADFMRHRVTQGLLGTYVATFIYSVLVVRAIRGSDFAGGFVPAISVTLAIILSVASLVLLIFFIHQCQRLFKSSVEDCARDIRVPARTIGALSATISIFRVETSTGKITK
jgi:uncharacterized membrane protein